MVTTRISTVERAGATHQLPDQRQGAGQPGLAGRVRQGRRRTTDANLVAVEPRRDRAHREAWTSKALKTAPAGALHRSHAAVAPWKAPASWWTTTNCARPCSEKGLGTPATRAAIIEGLINEKYMLRDGRELMPTAKAFQLMTLLRGLGVEDLTKPELTGNWEYQLAEMEHGGSAATPSCARSPRWPSASCARPRSTTATPSRATTPRLHDALPELRRRGEGELPPLRLRRRRRRSSRRLRLLDHQDPGGRTFETAEAEAFLRDKQHRPAGGFPLQGRLALHRRD
jgi:DNA topoisomerase-3